jgi:hypothetical protein
MAYRRFPSLKNNTEYTAFGVVPYSELIRGWGDIAGVESLSKKRRNKIRKIANSLDFMQRAMIKLRKSDHAHAKRSLSYLRQSFQRIRKTFVDEQACQDALWSVRCKNIYEELSSWRPPTKQTVNQFVKNMLDNAQACPHKKYAPKIVLVNKNGYINCRSCKLGQTVIFVNNKNGKCGRLDPVKAKGSVRQTLDDLDNPQKKSGGEAGVSIVDRRYPDICEKPGKNCKKTRADQLCKKRGFEDSTYFATIKYSRTRYANKKECVQTKEDKKARPLTCGTFVTLDCGCPPGTKPKGKKCVMI